MTVNRIVYRALKGPERAMADAAWLISWSPLSSITMLKVGGMLDSCGWSLFGRWCHLLRGFKASESSHAVPRVGVGAFQRSDIYMMQISYPGGGCWPCECLIIQKDQSRVVGLEFRVLIL